MNLFKRISISLSAFIFLIALGALSVFLIKDRNRKENLLILQIKDNQFSVEIADTVIAQARGLSGRASLAENQGMLFLFGDPAARNFWMAGMKFPLDIIWIIGDEIIGISENLPPATVTDTPVYSSPGPADKVLEINAGLSKKYGFKTGDKIVVE